MSFLILDSVGYETESKTLFRNMSSFPAAAARKAINDLIKKLKGDGTWNLLDTLWVTAAHDQQASRLNWKSPTTFTLTEVNAPSWAKNQGFISDGSTSYLNTGWDASTNGVNFTQNNASYGVYSRTDANTGTVELGGRNATTGNTFTIRTAGDVFNRRVNSTTNLLTGANTSSLGLHYAYRTDATNNTVGKNGVDINTGAATSATMLTTDIYICANNANGTAAAFSVHQISMAFLGSGSINQANFYTAIQAYMQAVGANV